jgi:hypothetical protein
MNVVVHAGWTFSALKRFKDDVKVAKGYDCGIQIKVIMT